MGLSLITTFLANLFQTLHDYVENFNVEKHFQSSHCSSQHDKTAADGVYKKHMIAKTEWFWKDPTLSSQTFNGSYQTFIGLALGFVIKTRCAKKGTREVYF